MIKVSTDKKDNYETLQGFTSGFLSSEPLKLKDWDEKSDNTHDLTDLQIMALRYIADRFIRENSDYFFISDTIDIDAHNAIQSAKLYLNNFEGFVAIIDDIFLNFSYLTYTSDNRIIAVAYEYNEDGCLYNYVHAYLLH